MNEKEREMARDRELVLHERSDWPDLFVFILLFSSCFELLRIAK